MSQTRTLSAALAQFQIALQQTKTNLQETSRLRVTVNEIQKRLDTITAAQQQSPVPVNSATNESPGSLSP